MCGTQPVHMQALIPQGKIVAAVCVPTKSRWAGQRLTEKENGRVITKLNLTFGM